MIFGLAFDPANPEVIYVGDHKSVDGGQTWHRMTGICPGVISLSMTPQNPSVILAGVHDAVCRTEDSGKTWLRVLDLQITEDAFDPATAVAFDPQNPSIAYAGTASGRLFKSTDGGLSWFELPSITKRVIGEIIVHPTDSNKLFLATGNWYLTSLTGGQQIGVSYDGVLISRDGGMTWERPSNELTDQAINGLVLARANPNVLYAAATRWFADRPPENGIYKSTDGGQSWSLVLKLGATMSAALAVDPTNENIVYTILAGSAWKTTDGGQTWRRFSWPNIEHVYYTHEMEVLPSNPNVLYTVTYLRGFMKSTDAGEHWTWSSVGIPYAIISSLFVHPQDRNFVIAGSYGGGLNLSKDGGIHWERGYINTTVHHIYTIAVDPQNPNILYAGVSGGRLPTGLAMQTAEVDSGVYKSVNGGKTWRKISEGLVGDQERIPEGGALQVYFIAVDPVDTNILYAGTTVNGIFKSEDGGESWRPINEGIPQQFRYVWAETPGIQERCERGELGEDLLFVDCYRYATWNTMSIAINPHDHHEVWYTTLAGVFRSRDGGEHWELVSEVFRGIHAHFMAFDPEDPNVIYVGTHKSGVTEEGHEIDSQHGLFISRDGGRTWSQVGPDGPGEGYSIRAIAVDRSDPRNVYVGTATGELFISHDKGRSWTRAIIVDEEGKPAAHFGKIDYLALGPEGKVIYSGTNGQGVFRGITHYIPGSPPDISVTGFHLPAEVEVGKEFTVEATVDNLGDQDGSYRVTLYIDGEQIDSRRVMVPGRGVRLVSFRARISKAGIHQVAVNDLPPKSISVRETAIGPDLAATALQVGPPPPYQGGPIKVTLLVENKGNQDYIGHFDIRFQVDHQDIGTITAPKTAQPLLRAGEAIEIPFYWLEAALALGSHQMSVTIDPENSISELNETNNTAEINFTISERRRIFLDDFETGLDRWRVQGDWRIKREDGNAFVIGKDLAFLEARNFQAKDFAIELDFKLKRGGFGVLFRGGPQGSYEFGLHEEWPYYFTLWRHPGELLADQGIIIPNPNAWHHLTIIAFEDIIRVYVDHDVWLDIRHEHPLLEAGGLTLIVHEGETWFDNFQVIALGRPTSSVSGALDLAVTQLVIVPEDPVPEDTVQFITTITNQGSVEIAQPIIVEFRLDGKLIATMPILSAGEVLLPGGRSQIQAYWQAVEGDHQVEVMVDPAAELGENNRENNKRKLSFTVAERTILFEDDFESGGMDWEEIKDPLNCWKIIEERGNHFLRGVNDGQCDPPLSKLAPSWSDFAFQARFRLVQGSFHIFSRLSIEQGRWADSYVLSIEPLQVVLLKRRSDQEPLTELLTFPWQGDDLWHTFRILTVGSHIQVFIDGISVIDYTDLEPILSGGIAFLLISGTVDVDDVRVLEIRP